MIPKKLQIRQRVMEEAIFLVFRQSTIRATAQAFSISKSTVYDDLVKRLPRISLEWSKEVRCILDKNKAESHIRGGNATAKKYSACSQKKESS